jgi:membrane protease YdiL (CAAX protease family)
VDPDPEARGPWPAAVSFAFLVALTALMVAVQGIAALVATVVEMLANRGARLDAQNFKLTGTTLSWCMLASAAVVPPAAWWIARVRRTGDTRRYFGLGPWRVLDFLLGLAGVVAVGVLAEFLVKEQNAEMASYYRSGNPRWFLWLAMILLGPLVEEIVFRGVVFDGMAATPAGLWGAVVATSAVWSFIHLQYGPTEMSVIFMLGLVLGGVRARTGSVTPCLLLHALNNAFAVASLAHELGEWTP